MDGGARRGPVAYHSKSGFRELSREHLPMTERIWDEYVAVATWAHRMLPDESLPGHISPYQMFFGRAPRTPIDELAPSLDNSYPALGLTPSVEETRRKHAEVAAALRKRQEEKNRHRDLRNSQTSRTSAGAKAQVTQRTVVASDIKPFYSRPVDLRLQFEDEMSTMCGDRTWGSSRTPSQPLRSTL